MKKIILSIFIIVCYSLDAISQQLPLFTQYRENVGFINPAALNSDFFTNGHNLSFGVTHRSQWVGFEGGPKTQMLRGEYLKDDGNAVSLLLGGYFSHDNTDPLSTTGFSGRLGGVLSDNPEYGGFSVGLSFGTTQYRMNTSELAIRDNMDVDADNYTKWLPDVGIGVYYYQKMGRGNYFYSGLSVPQVLGSSLMFEGVEKDFSLNRVQHVYGLLGFYKMLKEDTFLEASAWAKYIPNAPFNLDFNLRYQINPTFYIGTGGSTAGNVHLEAGLILDWKIGLENSCIRIGYGYDHAFTSYGTRNHFGDTHEINLTYALTTR